MPCEEPLQAYRLTTGGPALFTRPDRPHVGITLPCGRCILCRLEHARQWACRITHEQTFHDESCFVTLTYSDDNLPTDEGTPTLNYRHLQLFWKRLRKQTGANIRYYAVGEYGEKTQRPHYHACIFGHAFVENRTILRQTPTLLWDSPTLKEAWQLGNVSVGALTYATANYTAAYVTKKLFGKRYRRVDHETGELVDLVQPRAFMSLRPAIGRSWIEQHHEQTYQHDRIVLNGAPQKPPKYYDRWLEKQSETRYEQLKQSRKENIQQYSTKELRARAEIAHARNRQKANKI